MIASITITDFSNFQNIFSTIENNNSNNTSDSKTDSSDGMKSIGSHTPGYPSIQSKGSVLDPISVKGSSENAVIDPSKYLREFNYGKVSTLPNGTTLREFTLIASDSEVKEISPESFIMFGHLMELFQVQQ